MTETRAARRILSSVTAEPPRGFAGARGDSRACAYGLLKDASDDRARRDIAGLPARVRRP